jgi:hypothetical protein
MVAQSPALRCVQAGPASAPIGRPPLHIFYANVCRFPDDIDAEHLTPHNATCVFVVRLPQHTLRHCQLPTGPWLTRPLPRRGPPLQRRPRSKRHVSVESV